MIKVVVCGSYHRDSEGLARVFRELESHSCRILMPISIDFENMHTAVVRTPPEQNLSINELEAFHLRAIYDADFIWLHNPAGHIGVSGSYELGYANALRIPVFCNEVPKDEMLRTRVVVVKSVFEALEDIGLR